MSETEFERTARAEAAEVCGCSSYSEAANAFLEGAYWGRNYQDEIATLRARVRELEEGVVLALPYVECAEHDEGYKPGVVKKLAESLRALLTKENGE